MLENHMVVDAYWWSIEHPYDEEEATAEMTAAEEQWEADRDEYMMEKEDEGWTE